MSVLPRRPEVWKTSALLAELMPHLSVLLRLISTVERVGFEPTAFSTQASSLQPDPFDHSGTSPYRQSASTNLLLILSQQGESSAMSAPL